MFARRIGWIGLMLIAATLVGDAAQAAGPLHRRHNPGLFGNYYANGVDGYGSRAYPSPLPVPAWVGNTSYTYQPFYPHHHMWSHYDVYRRRAPGHLLPANTTRAFYW